MVYVADSTTFIDPLSIFMSFTVTIKYFQFPSKIPVIVERYKKERDLPRLDKVKFLVPQELSVSQFCVVVRSRLVVRPSQSLHFIVGNKTGNPWALLVSTTVNYSRCSLGR